MCQLTVMMRRDGQDEVVARDVASIEAAADDLTLVSLFDDPVTLHNVHLLRIDSLNGTVVLAENRP